MTNPVNIMAEPSRVVGCDGSRYYFRRELGHEAIRDRIAQNIERGWFKHERTEGNVEVYLLTETAPHRVRQLAPGADAINELLDELIRDAITENLEHYEAGLRELATMLKSAGNDVGDFTSLVHVVTKAAIDKTGDAFLGARLRYGVGEIRKKRQGSVIIQLPARH